MLVYYWCYTLIPKLTALEPPECHLIQLYLQVFNYGVVGILLITYSIVYFKKLRFEGLKELSVVSVLAGGWFIALLYLLKQYPVRECLQGTDLINFVNLCLYGALTAPFTVTLLGTVLYFLFYTCVCCCGKP